MYRWIGGFRLLLGIAIIVTSYNVGYCQDAKPKFEVESSAGVFFFDESLSFDRSPSFGLGAGYDITSFLQLNLAFSLNPARKRISAASSKITTNIFVYNYYINLRFQKRKPMFPKIKPFLNLGTGGIILNPQKVSLDLGGGQMIQLEPPSEHKFAFNFGGGFAIPLSKRFALRLEYRKYLYKSNKILDDGIRTTSVTAQNDYLGLGFSTFF